MKKSFQSQGLLLLLLLVLVCFSWTASARLLASQQGKEGLKISGITQTGPAFEIREEDSLNLMGMEDCDNGDEECLKRRMVSEAHLDYIYTQHHKP